MTIGWTLDDPDREMLSDLGRQLDRSPAGRIALLIGDRASPLGRAIPMAYPQLEEHRVDIRLPPDDLHTALAAHGPYDLIIDDSRRLRVRKRVFRNSFGHLRPGGAYLVRDFRPRRHPPGERPHDNVLWPYLTQLVGRRGRVPARLGRWQQDEEFRAESLGRLILGTHHLLAFNRLAAYAKLREHEMNTIADQLTAEATGGTPSPARVVLRRPSASFESRATVSPASLYETDFRFTRHFAAPELVVRGYRDAIAVPHQVALQGYRVLPESFRHNQYPRLGNRRLTRAGHYFARIDGIADPTRLPGRYFHLDAEWREHFGHFTTEQLARLWPWSELKQQMPDLRLLMSLQRGRTEPRSWELDLLAAAGVGSDDIVPIVGPTQVEELFGATPMASMPSYIHPAISDLWRTVGDNLVRQAPPQLEPGRDYPRRIFLTRPSDARLRQCRNTDEVESRFRAAGFGVVRPELFPIATQVRMIRSASVIAGFAGSAMFNLMFHTYPAQVIVLRQTAYTASNEYLISSVLGNTIHYVDSEPDIPHPPRHWSRAAFHSSFAFDFDREGRQLDNILASLPTTDDRNS
jgi:capsular polysaccharide biosynthesis protein